MQEPESETPKPKKKRLPKPITGSYTLWDNGIPYKGYIEPLTKGRMGAIYPFELAQPYHPKKYENPDTGELEIAEDDRQYEGLSKAEVMVRRRVNAAADGDLDSQKYVEDRYLGKPMQQVQNMNVSISIEDYLKTLPMPKSSPLYEMDTDTDVDVEDASIVPNAAADLDGDDWI